MVNNPSEDPLKGLVPLGPLGLFSAARQPNSGSSPGPGSALSGKPTHQLPFSSKIDQFCGGVATGGGGGTTIAANATTLFQPQGTIYIYSFNFV